MRTAVDTSVILDVLTRDPRFGETSLRALKAAYSAGALVAGEVVDAEQILLHSWISTSSRPSVSSRWTWTLCVSEVGRFFPT